MSLNYCGQCGGRMVEGANPGFTPYSAKFDTETGLPLREPEVFVRCENDPLRDKYASDNRHTVGYISPAKGLPPPNLSLIGTEYPPTKPASLGRWLRKVVGRE